MNYVKVGKLILSLRREKELTQKQLADIIHVSDKTISKWERGLGCPDVSLLRGLSDFFSVDIEKILKGELDTNDKDGGNMKRIKFYMCPHCGNIITATGEAEVSCCGRKLTALEPKQSDENHNLNIEMAEDEFYITFEHEMTKEHFISFIACVSWDRVMLVRLYPEQGSEIRMPRIPGGKFYFGCNKHGLWVKE